MGIIFNHIMAQLEQKSRSAIQIKPGDYYGDGSITLYVQGKVSCDANGQPLTDKGLLYCGKCHSLKQIRQYASFLGRVIEPYAVCECEARQIEQEYNRLADENQQRQIAINLSQADSLMLKNTFAVDKQPESEVSKVFRDYCRHWRDKYRLKNIGLYIFGDVGVGKSFYAACIANEVARVYGDTIKVVSAVRIINDLYSADDKSGYIDSLAAVDLLIIDDFGAERKSEYGYEQMFSVIDERCKAQKPLILTSNLDCKSLLQKGNITQRRIYDRVKDMCVPIKMDGESKRGIEI